jgi:4-amino-4-deoxy-L-arabinose transferase-like glycosyltransferase
MSRFRALPWLAVLLLALAVRAPALVAARPYFSYVDEGHTLHVCARMLGSGSWIPETFLYPSLPITAIVAAARAIDPFYPIRDGLATRSGDYYDVLEPFGFLLLGRVMSLLAGLGVVLLTGLLARRVAGPRAGLLAALAAALVPALAIRGAITTVDPYAALFTTACLLFTERTRTAEPGRDRREALAAGAMAGLAFASKYPAVLVLSAFALTVWLSRPAWRERLRLGSIAAAGAAGAALLAMPGLVAAPDKVLEAFRIVSSFYGSITSPSIWSQVFVRAEWDVPFEGPELGGAFVALALAGLGVALRDRRTRAAACGWVLYMAVSLVLHGRQSFQPFRNLLPLVPIACVAVAVLHASVRLRVPKPGWADAAAVLLIAALLGPSVVRFARERAAFADSRTQTIDWLLRHSRPGQTVLILNDLVFLPSEIGRLEGRTVEVESWDLLRQRLPARRARYLVITQMSTPEGRPLISREQIGEIRKLYRQRAELGDGRPAADPGYWRGNRQVILVLERRRPAHRAGEAARRSSVP